MMMCSTDDERSLVRVAQGVKIRVLRFPTPFGLHVELRAEGLPHERAVFEARSEAEIEAILTAFAATVRLRHG
jgi:hypothetical protein